MQPSNVNCLLANIFHVRRAGAHVFACDESAEQRIDETSMRAENSLPVFGCVVPNDDRFAAAEGQLSQTVLVGHAASQAQGILKSFLLRAVIPKTGSAACGTAYRAVNSDDGVVAGFRSLGDYHAFITRDRFLRDLHCAGV